MTLCVSFVDLVVVVVRGIQKTRKSKPGLNFNSGFLTALLKSLFWIIFFIFLKASNHQIVDKTNYNEFSSIALTL